MNYYRRFPGDYARDTRHLSFAEHGAYAILLDVLYSTERPLPRDPKETGRIVGARDARELSVVEGVLREFFTETSKGWTHKRVKKEISLYKSKICAMRENGKKGGRPRKQTESKSFFSEKQNKPSPEPEPNPDPKEREEKTNYAAAPPVPAPLWADFVEMRKKIRKPLTTRAVELICRKLEQFQLAGDDPITVLEQSIMNSWAGVFPIKKENRNGRAESFAERNIRRADEELGDVSRRAQQTLQEMGKSLPESTNRTRGSDGLFGSVGGPKPRAN